jgi:hypothetical protein
MKTGEFIFLLAFTLPPLATITQPSPKPVSRTEAHVAFIIHNAGIDVKGRVDNVVADINFRSDALHESHCCNCQHGND